MIATQNGSRDSRMQLVKRVACKHSVQAQAGHWYILTALAGHSAPCLGMHVQSTHYRQDPDLIMVFTNSPECQRLLL